MSLRSELHELAISIAADEDIRRKQVISTAEQISTSLPADEREKFLSALRWAVWSDVHRYSKEETL